MKPIEERLLRLEQQSGLAPMVTTARAPIHHQQAAVYSAPQPTPAYMAPSTPAAMPEPTMTAAAPPSVLRSQPSTMQMRAYYPQVQSSESLYQSMDDEPVIQVYIDGGAHAPRLYIYIYIYICILHQFVSMCITKRLVCEWAGGISTMI